jgi:hypothetical protein
MLNAFANYLCGVEKEDDFRYLLITYEEKQKGNQE